MDLSRTLVLSAIVVTVLSLTSQDAMARRADAEFGVGIIVGLEATSNQPINEGIAYGAGLAFELNEDLDLEFAFTRARGRDPGDDSLRNAYFTNLGLRWYPFAKHGVQARFFLGFGGARVTGLEASTTVNAWYLAPGVRIQAGEKSGLIVRIPMVFAAEGDTNSVVLPGLSWFIEFD